MWCWHTWTKWEYYVWHGSVLGYISQKWHEISEERQRRFCEKCGHRQDARVDLT